MWDLGSKPDLFCFLFLCVSVCVWGGGESLCYMCSCVQVCAPASYTHRGQRSMLDALLYHSPATFFH